VSTTFKAPISPTTKVMAVAYRAVEGEEMLETRSISVEFFVMTRSRHFTKMAARP